MRNLFWMDCMKRKRKVLQVAASWTFSERLSGDFYITVDFSAVISYDSCSYTFTCRLTFGAMVSQPVDESTFTEASDLKPVVTKGIVGCFGSAFWLFQGSYYRIRSGICICQMRLWVWLGHWGREIFIHMKGRCVHFLIIYFFLK